MTGTPSFISRLIPLRLPRVCVPVTGSDATDLVDKAEALVRDNTFLEFRLDHLSHPAQALPKIKRFTEYHPQVVVIATCRRQANGGKLAGALAPQFEGPSNAPPAACQLLDPQPQIAPKGKPEPPPRLRSKAAFINSFQ